MTPSSHLLTRVVAGPSGQALTLHTSPTTSDRSSLPWLVLIAPPGLSAMVWRNQASFLGRTFNLLAWDLRQHSNTTNKKRRNEEVNASAHLEDFQAAIDLVGTSKASLVTWGLGAQIGLDIAAKLPEQITHFIALCARLTPGFIRSLGLDDAVVKLPALVSGTCSYAAPFAPALGSLLRPSAHTLHRLGVVSPTLDDELYDDVNATLGSVDRQGLQRVIEGLEHQRSRYRATPSHAELVDLG
ncbi:MAG: alpha/beta hydrolase [Polyangiaceae bacterium]